MNITKNTRKHKAELLQYFRNRSKEFIAEVNNNFGNMEYKKKAKKLNALLVKARRTLVEIIEQKANKEDWTNQEWQVSIINLRTIMNL